MGRHKKGGEHKDEVTAPFFALPYSDLVTLLMNLFILLYSMAVIDPIRFESYIGVIRGSFGISKLYDHAPIQKFLPAPSIKVSPRTVFRSEVKPTTLRPLSTYQRVDLTEPVQHEENDQVKTLRDFGLSNDIAVEQQEDDIILRLPTWEVFDKGEYKIKSKSPYVQKSLPMYRKLAEAIDKMIGYEIYIIGHTDTIPVNIDMDPSGPSNNLELGFYRAIALFSYFFNDYILDKSRVTFASKGDYHPIVKGASLDSEMRVNRRVEIYLRKQKV